MSSKCDFRFHPWDEYIFPPDWEIFSSPWDILERGAIERVDADTVSVKIGENTVRAETRPGNARVTLASEQAQGSVRMQPAGWTAVARGAFARGAISASKCDWQARLPALEAVGQDAVSRLRARLPAGDLVMGSDKCDWTIRAGTRERFATASLTSERVDLRGITPGFNGLLSSSKCDWTLRGRSELGQITADAAVNTVDLKLQAPLASTQVVVQPNEWRIEAGAHVPGVRAPQLDAGLAASKCDHRFRVTVGMRNGPTFRLRAVASAKCDFRFDAVEYAPDGDDFRPVPIEGKPAKKS